MLRGFAHEFHAAANLEFGEQRGNMELHGALGKIQEVGNFLVGKAFEDAIENFFLAAGKFNGAFGAVTGFEKFLGFFGKAENAFRGGLHHDHVVAGGLTADHAMHGEKASGMINGKFAVGAGFDMEMS